MATKKGEIKAEEEVLAKGTKVLPKTATVEKTEPKKVIVRPITTMNVRRFPENGDNSLFEPRRFVEPNDRLEVLDREGDWLYVNIGGAYKGWVMRSLTR